MEQLGVSKCEFIEDVENVKRFDLAKTLCINRKKEIDVVNNKLNQDIKSYIDDEDQYYREIQVQSEKLSASVSEGAKTLEFKQSTELDSKLQLLQKESRQIQQRLKETEDQKVQSTFEHQKQKGKLVKLIEEIQLSILNKLDLPEPDNKSGVIFNWIAGCLIKQKKGPIQLAAHLKLKIEQLQLPPESIINQPSGPQSGGLFACGGRKPMSSQRPIKRMILPEEEQRYSDNLCAWKAIKQYVFHQDFKFQEKVTQLTIEIDKLEPYQLMLIEEIVNEKKEIIRAIYDIDIKDQARILIEINEIILFLLKQKQIEQNQEQEEKKLEKMDENQRQIEIEIQIMVQQKQFQIAKEKRINALKSTLNLIKTHSDKITDYVKEKMSTNEQIIQQIEVMRTQSVSKELKVNTDIEDAYRRKKQEEAEKILQEQEQKEQEEAKRKKEDLEKKQFESNQRSEDVYVGNQAPEEVQQENQGGYDEDEDDDGDEDSDDDNEDGEKQDWIALSNDPETNLIQRTLFPDKVKTAENKNLAKQKNKGESLKALMIKRKKN